MAGDQHDPTHPESWQEVETKFDISPEFELPDLAPFARGRDHIDIDTVHLSSTYYDTAAMDLLRFHLTVRRRAAVGDTTDVGWQLKIPGDGFRTELHWPDEDTNLPPQPLRELLTPFLDGRELVPAVRLDVTRTRHRLVNESGELRAEIAQDEVHAVALGVAVRAERWLEVEIELGTGGGRSLLARIGRAMVKAGAGPSTSRSKLARAVSGLGNESVGGPHASAGAVLSDYVSTQADAIVAGHFATQEDVVDSVHQTRVACRRLRSTLRTFIACYDETAAVALEVQLGWYAGVLGAVRDLEVLRARLAHHIDQLPATLSVGGAKEHIDERLATRLTSARAALIEVQHSKRYARLLARVIEWRDDPPFTVAAGRPAATLIKPVQHAEKVLGKRLAHATDPAGTDTDMHSARKAGKRARYANEVIRGGRSGQRAKKLQDLLGEFQDSVVAAEAIADLAGVAREQGEDTFIYGVLFGEERARADAARQQARRMA